MRQSHFMSKKFNWGDFKKLDNMETVIYPKKMVEKKPRRIESLMYWLYSHKIFVFGVSFLIGSMIGHFAFAEVIYSRDPGGTEVPSFSEIYVSWGDDDLNLGANCPSSGTGGEYERLWGIIACNDLVCENFDQSSMEPWGSGGEDSANTFEMNFTFDTYVYVMSYCQWTYPPEDETTWGCGGTCYQTGEPLEDGGGNIIFSIIENNNTGMFINVGGALIPQVEKSFKNSNTGFFGIVGWIAGIALAIGFSATLLEFIKSGVDHDNKMKELYKEAEKQHDILYKKGKK